jgi:hypothetical protein
MPNTTETSIEAADACQACGTITPDICSNCDCCIEHDCCECYTCGNCPRHCRHTTCLGCERRVETVCLHCHHCTEHDCCECYTCGSCGLAISPDDYCSDCERCDRCCQGHSDASDVMRHGNFRFHPSSKREFKRNPLQRFLSLELEVAGADEYEYIGNAADRWSDAIVEDGSLDSGGFEINTNPSNGDLFLSHITDLCDSLADGGARVNASCGMHCHVDASDLNYFDLYKLCILYSRLESTLFELVSPRRASNSYCRTYGHKYSALVGNFPSFKRGLVELLYDAQQATSWAMVCGHIVDAASRMNYGDIVKLVSESPDGYDLLKAILPVSLHSYVDSRLAYWLAKKGY